MDSSAHVRIRISPQSDLAAEARTGRSPGTGLGPWIAGVYSDAVRALGDYIAGAFLAPSGQPLVSLNPARAGACVLETGCAVGARSRPCGDAAAAAPGLGAPRLAERAAHLARFRGAGRARPAIWPRRSSSRPASCAARRQPRSSPAGPLRPGRKRGDAADRGRARRAQREAAPPPARRGRRDRARSTSRSTSVTPTSIPALFTGNAVVVKPSEVTPLAGQRYAEAAHAAGLPAGVFNLVQGGAAAGAALVAQPAVRGLCFTGSYRVGRRILEAALDRPEVLLALEMGGKNTAVVLDDADLHQAAHEIALGGYLTTGPALHRHRAGAGPPRDRRRPGRRARAAGLGAALRRSRRRGGFAGPLTTAAGRAGWWPRSRPRAPPAPSRWSPGRRLGRRQRFFIAVGAPPARRRPRHRRLHRRGAVRPRPVRRGGRATTRRSRSCAPAASAWPPACSPATTSASSASTARPTPASSTATARPTWPARSCRSAGWAGAATTARPARTRRATWSTRSRCRRTCSAGAVLHPQLAELMPEPDLDRLAAQHAREEEAEAARTLLDLPRPRDLRLPAGRRAARVGGAGCARLYAGDRVVEEKKPPVFDHLRSSGPWFVSIDDEPLAVLDGMSQTAT